MFGHRDRAQGRDEAAWLKQDLDQQLKDVMSQILNRRRRWDDNGPSGVPPLELYKKRTLVEKRTGEARRATALHILARQYGTDYAGIPGEIIRPIIRDLLLQNGELSADAERGGRRKEEPILKVAIMFNSDEFIYQVQKAWPEAFPALLDAKDSDGKNALHHIFAWPDRKMTVRPEADARMTLRRAMEFVQVAMNETVAAQDADGNTPLHYAADYRQCDLQPDEYVDMYVAMVHKADDLMRGEKAFNKWGESSSLYGQSTLAHCERVKGTRIKARAAAYIEIQQFLKVHYIRSRRDMDARDLVYGKDASYKNLYFDASFHSRADDMTTLIDRLSVGGFEDTLAYVYIPPLALPTAEKKTSSTSRWRPGQVQENPNMGRNDLIKVFDKLSSCGVTRILNVQVDDLYEPSHTDSAIEMALRGADPPAPRYRHQRPAHARNPAHPSILVETWDWRRADISADVIAAVAPGVKHVKLYWSGKQAVLRGWGDASAGIPRLAKLKTLKVYAAPGGESAARMKQILEMFKNEIITNTRGRVTEIKIVPRMRGLVGPRDVNDEQSDPSSSPADGRVAPNRHVWVSTMDEFRNSMMSIHNTLEGLRMDMEPYKIKVAVIDDGLDLNELATYNNTVTAKGQSYFPPMGGAENPWHCSSGGHGTIMANMITRVNPWVSLHVLKVHDGWTSRGERTIFADSAARAVWGAIRRHVNIISISWTVKGRMPVRSPRGGSPVMDSDVAAIGKLEEAIDEAVRRGILIFCSASDRPEEKANDSLPYRQAPGRVFRIGAALPNGKPAPETEDQGRIDYFLPGSQVPEDVDPRGSKVPELHDGSSVSTALAAGLASLIMHCAVVMREYHKQAPGSKHRAIHDYYAKAAAALQSRDNMKRAFDNIGIGKPEDRYLEVWREFGAAAGAIAALGTKGGDKKMEVLDQLARTLCHKTKLDDVVHGQFGA
ncbi:hypothetical protein B0I37DRAFT_410945 [Chaetomium sp. MPI-CAGE-AT-0009]|nr:hypothetical protein B0I37DRAFT_410945 [Chaetomium sp. MPI-CAGE-AT-0009]